MKPEFVSHLLPQSGLEASTSTYQTTSFLLEEQAPPTEPAETVRVAVTVGVSLPTVIEVRLYEEEALVAWVENIVTVRVPPVTPQSNATAFTSVHVYIIYDSESPKLGRGEVSKFYCVKHFVRGG